MGSAIAHLLCACVTSALALDALRELQILVDRCDVHNRDVLHHGGTKCLQALSGDALGSVWRAPQYVLLLVQPRSECVHDELLCTSRAEPGMILYWYTSMTHHSRFIPGMRSTCSRV
eukprot:COSAG02_NODE_23073_length_731_cov_0.892405_2_plen_117_part_00